MATFRLCQERGRKHIYKESKSTEIHHKPKRLGDHCAFLFVKLLRFFADSFFAKRYGHRVIVLETIAAIPGMVGGSLLHLRSLRRMEDDHGWIKTLLDEAENERMHLMTFVQIVKPTLFERFLVILAQAFFYLLYLLLYIISQRTAHRAVGYLEEEAVSSYTQYLDLIDRGTVRNVPAPGIAIKYWGLPENATLRDVIIAVRRDEMKHRDINHCMADKIANEPCSIEEGTDGLRKYINRQSPQ
jgi:ubiquinol oxidase